MPFWFQTSEARLTLPKRGFSTPTFRLETTTFMGTAIALHPSVVYKTCPAYYVVPESFQAITVFMQLNLADVK